MAWTTDIITADTRLGSYSPGFKLKITVTGGYPFLYSADTFVNTASFQDMVLFPDEASAEPGETVVRRAEVELIFRCAKARDDMLEMLREDIYELERFNPP